jgi:uncharacterized protein YaaQ
VKLITAVVRDELAPTLTDRLSEKGFSATKLASSGGFLKAGNTTFLIGVSEAQLETALQTIQAVCPGSTVSKDADAKKGKVEVAGAAVFVLDVESTVKV